MAGFWRRLVERFNPLADKEEPIDWEALLLEADLGSALALRWTGALEKRGLLHKAAEAEAFLAGELRSLVAVPPLAPASSKPQVDLLVGVNGGGKTTTAAKLAHRAQKEGRTVVLGAADTFRAAAVDQLQVWGERLGVPVVSDKPGTDPASVAFRSHEAAVQGGADLLIVDTAGRLANKNNLMLELEKVTRTLRKRDTAAPHRVWLVADGTSGNNVVTQAREFHKAVGAAGLTGLILTKYDSSAKGGTIAAVRAELGVPTYFVGKGEGLDDLEPFDPEAYVRDFFHR